MRFVEIQARLLSRIGQLIRNGELTERGFARISGISQPHIHKVLKGTRTLSTGRFDLLLKSLNCSVLDLFQEEELRNHLARGGRREPACFELPLRLTALGPGLPWPTGETSQEHYPVPCSLLPSDTSLALVRLSPDPDMPQTLKNCTIAALELTSSSATQAGSLYAVDRGGNAVLRGVRRGSDRLYLVSDENRNDPLRWETVPAADSHGRSVIRGRVVWLNDDTLKKPPQRENGHFFDNATSSYVART
jgi:transcriptional regulator with XRE-family HTH domain